MNLRVPATTPDMSTLDVALAWAAGGFYVGPLDLATKHPGTILKTGWPSKTSRDPRAIIDWFTGNAEDTVGAFAHVGRSGAVALDADNHANLNPDVRTELERVNAPFQSTRADDPARGHYLILQPPDRTIGNGGAAKLGTGWGEIRGKNGVIVIGGRHEKAAQGGRYLVTRPGAVPAAPAITDLLPAATDTTDAATDSQVVAFLDRHTSQAKPDLLKAPLNRLQALLDAGEGRHPSTLEILCWTMREAAAGMYPARTAVKQIEAMFAMAVAGEEGRAADEFAGMVAWAVAQALAVDVEQVRDKIEERTAAPTTATIGDPWPTPETSATTTPLLDFVSFADLAAEVDAMGPRQWLIEGIWPAGDYGVHAAEAKAQKTWNSVDLAVSVATGTPWLGAFEIGTPGPVLIFHGEGGKQSIVRRIRAVLRARGIDHDDIPVDVCVRAPHLSDVEHMREFEARVAATQPALVILDPFYLAARGGDKGDLYSMGGMLETPQRICQKYGASFFVVHHFNRQHGSGAGRISGAGPSEWARILLTATVKARNTDPSTRATDVVTELDLVGGEVPDRTIRIRRHVQADNPDDLDSPLHVTVTATDKGDDAGATAEGGRDLPPAARKLMEALTAADGEPRTGPALVDWIAAHHGHGLTRETVSRTLNDLEGRGLADSIDQGQFKAKLWILKPPEPSCDSCDVTRDGHTDDCRVTRVTTPIGGHTSHVTGSHHTGEDPQHHTVPCRGCGTTEGTVRVGAMDEWTCDPCWAEAVSA